MKRTRSLFKPIRRWWLDNLTIVGKSIALIAVFCVHGCVSTETPMIHLFSMMVSMLMIAAVVNFFYRTQLQATLAMPYRVQVGEIFTMTITLTNQGSLPAYDFSIDMEDLPEGWQLLSRIDGVLMLAPGASMKIQCKARLTRRGECLTPKLIARTTFPFALVLRRQNLKARRTVLVIPRHRPMPHLAPIAEHGESRSLEASTTVTGTSIEYLGNTEYRPGVPVRRWDYRSWARLGFPVVREYEEIAESNSIIVVDAFAAAGDAGQVDVDFERIVTLSACVADMLNSIGIRVEALLVGPHHYARQGEFLDSSLDFILDHLATAELAEVQRDYRFAPNVANTTVSTGMIVFVTSTHRIQERPDLRSDVVRSFEDLGNVVVPVVVGEENPGFPREILVAPAEIDLEGES